MACRCKPNRSASIEQIRKLGVLSWKLDADSHENDPKLKAIRAVRNYSYQVMALQQHKVPLGACEQNNCMRAP